MEIIPDFLTIIRGPKPINKTVVVENGAPKKIPNAAISRAQAKTVYVPDVNEMVRLQETVGNDPHMALISGYALGTEPGDQYELRPEAEIKSAHPSYRSGFVQIGGTKVISRTKRNFAASTWINFDRDVDPDCPADLNDLNDTDYVYRLSSIIGDIMGAGLVIVPSTSGRVRFKGEPLGKGGARYWFQCKQPASDDLGQQLMFAAIEHELAYLKHSKSDAALIRTIFDTSVFSRERIVFDGMPTLRGDGLTLDPQKLTVQDGERIDLDRVKQYALAERIMLQRSVRGIPDNTEIQTTLDGGLSWCDEAGRILTETVSKTGSVWQTVEGQLQLDTPIEVKQGATTPRDFYAMGVAKLRAQYPFRQGADGWSAILRMEGGMPSLFDVVSNTKHILSSADRKALAFGSES